MAAGLPVVISRLGGIPEIVADGLTGYLVDPEDYGAFSDSLDRLVKNPSLREQMGTAARERAVAEFDCRANISRILNIMKAGPATAPRRRIRSQAPNPVPASTLEEELDDVTSAGRVPMR
jgi:hypothetical protein